MNFPIYVLGDISAFISVLNSVAMVFNDTAFLGGAGLLGAFVTLLAFLMYLMNKEAGASIMPGGSPLVGLIAFIIFFTGLGIKTKVVVQDTFTGNTAMVDNIPAVISMPASVFTSAVNAIFGRTNTAFQGTDGSFISLGESGFVQPLKIIHSLRNSMETVDPFLAATTHKFVLNCTLSSGINMNTLVNSPDVVSYITTNARDNGLTTVYDSANPDGYSTSCAQAKTIVANRSLQLMNTADPAFNGKTKIGTMVVRNMTQKTAQTTPPTPADIEDAVQRVVLNRMGGTTQSAGQFMLNSVMYNTLTNAFNCRDKAGDAAAYTACDTMATQAFEQWKTESAGAGTLFTKTMLPAMVFMQLMFFSLAPIVLIFALVKGSAGIALYVKFLGFGVWTASWLPVAGVIQMYIQNNVAGKLSQLSEKALTMGNFKVIYFDVISTNLALASDMLAATPVLTATILGLSGMAMSSLANRYGGKDKIDQTQATPDLMRNGALLQATGMRDVNANTGVSTKTGAITPELSFAAGSTSTMQSAQAKRQVDAAQVGADLTRTLADAQQRVLSRMNTAGNTLTVQESTGGRTQDGTSMQYSEKEMTAEQKQAAAAATVRAQAAMTMGTQINAALAPQMIRALSSKGMKGGSEADWAKALETSAAQASAKDASFMQKVAAGDANAIGTLVDGAFDVAAVAGFVVGSAGTPVTGAAAGVAIKAAGKASKGAIVSGIQKVAGAIGRNGETLRGMSAAVFDNTSAGLKAEIGAQLANSEAFTNTNSQSRDKVASTMADWSNQSYTAHDRTKARTTGEQRQDASQLSASDQISNAFKQAQTRMNTIDDTFTRSAGQSADSSVKFSGSADKFVSFLRSNPQFAQQLRNDLKSEDMQLIAQPMAKNTQMLDSGIANGLRGDERELLSYAMLLSSRGQQANPLGAKPPAGDMGASTNQDLKKPEIDPAIRHATQMAPQPGQVKAPNLNEVAPLSGKPLRTEPVPQQPSGTPPAPKPQKGAPLVAGGQSDGGTRGDGVAPAPVAGAQPALASGLTPSEQPANAGTPAQPPAPAAKAEKPAPKVANGQRENERQPQKPSPKPAPAAPTPPQPTPPAPPTHAALAAKVRALEANSDPKAAVGSDKPVVMAPRPDANALSVGNVLGATMDTQFGKVVGTTAAVVAGANMFSGIPDRPTRAKAPGSGPEDGTSPKNGQPMTPGTGAQPSEPPQSRPGAKLEGGNGKPPAPRPAPRRKMGKR